MNVQSNNSACAQKYLRFFFLSFVGIPARVVSVNTLYEKDIRSACITKVAGIHNIQN